jgi:hypothetical protein
MTFSFPETYRDHKKLTILGGIFLVWAVYATFTGTLLYPFIMIDRQVQSIKDCTFGSPHFNTDFYDASFSVPETYCVLPNRLFPRDGSIEIVPKGWYFVFNEYAKGTVASGSIVTLLFEPVMPDRDPDKIIQTLVSGNFLDIKDVTSTTTASGTRFIFASNARGTDDNRYDWAFVVRPDNKYFVAIVGHHADSEPVREYLFNTFDFR